MIFMIFIEVDQGFCFPRRKGRDDLSTSGRRNKREGLSRILGMMDIEFHISQPEDVVGGYTVMSEWKLSVTYSEKKKIPILPKRVQQVFRDLR
jgi:hypothetical protein